MRGFLLRTFLMSPRIKIKGTLKMVYKEMYLKLFNAVTDALAEIDENFNIVNAVHILKKAQFDCEEIYLSAEDEEPKIIPIK